MAKDDVKKVDYWHVEVVDQPGTADQVLQRLASAKVNLLAFLAFPIPGGKSQLDLFPADAGAFEKAAKTAGVSLSAKKSALFVQGRDRMGALAEATKRLAAKKINMTAATAVATPSGGYGFIVWVKQPDVDAALAALSS
jgi:hypothetical protein